jgi:hypothetical protein
MKKVTTEGAKGVRNRSADSGKSAENAKKMLFRGNEAKNTLKTKHLAFSGAQNELFFDTRNPRSNPRIQPKDQVSGFRGESLLLNPAFRPLHARLAMCCAYLVLEALAGVCYSVPSVVKGRW